MTGPVPSLNETTSQVSFLSSEENTTSVDHSAIIANKHVGSIFIAQQEGTNKPISVTQEGQSINNGYNNNLQIELLKVKRIHNPETKEADNIVAVSLRVKRVVANISNSPINRIKFYDAKAKNINTYEEYQAIHNRTTKTTSLSSLQLNVWSDAYLWLAIPKGIDVIDIIFPYTEVFKNVPIEN